MIPFPPPSFSQWQYIFVLSFWMEQIAPVLNSHAPIHPNSSSRSQHACLIPACLFLWFASGPAYCVPLLGNHSYIHMWKRRKREKRIAFTNVGMCNNASAESGGRMLAVRFPEWEYRNKQERNRSGF